MHAVGPWLKHIDFTGHAPGASDPNLDGSLETGQARRLADLIRSLDHFHRSRLRHNGSARTKILVSVGQAAIAGMTPDMPFYGLLKLSRDDLGLTG
jgi:hypothetical protein